ncbi:MAG: glycosyltransferase, partial [Bacteroidetes bacterium]|nr:glycosyltransferase [Bacteroidota bacterium]
PFGTAAQTRGGIVKNTLSVSRLLFSRPDIVHSFGRLAYLSALMPLPIPKIMSYQREPTITQVRKAARFSAGGSLLFTGCSDYITSQINPFARAVTVYNAVSMQDYEFRPDVPDEAPLVFLGRIEPIKGTHIAIEVARRSGRRLVIAGNVPDYAMDYFGREVGPHLDDNQIRYIGAVDDPQKNELLGAACALLMPVQWNEPFGIVMAEALACGTPVIALRGGATSEVVVSGVNGFLCDGPPGMVETVKNITAVSRAACRRDAENRFSSKVMAENYEKLYYQMTLQNGQ